MRDARRIKERDDDKAASRFGVLFLLVLGAVVVSYNIGLKVGMSRADIPVVDPGQNPTALTKLDNAQQKHDAMQFYTRLTQEAPKSPEVATEASVNVVVAPNPEERIAVPKGEMNETESEEAPSVKQESTKGAIARLGGLDLREGSVAQPEKGSGNFTVQVSAFQTQEEADAYKASLVRKGYEPYVVAAEIPGKGIWYRVRVGRFEDKDAATEAKASLALANIPSFIVAAQ